MKYSEALRRSVTLRRTHSVYKTRRCPLCTEVKNRVGEQSCLGCPVSVKETWHLKSLPPFFGCWWMAEEITGGNKEIERLILELAMAYEMAGD